MGNARHCVFSQWRGNSAERSITVEKRAAVPQSGRRPSATLSPTTTGAGDLRVQARELIQAPAM
jgi:hypothetical protein